MGTDGYLRGGMSTVRQRALWDVLTVVLASLWIAVVLRVDLVVVNSVPAGGDATAHVLWADAMRGLITDGQLSGWSMDWFAGFPVGRFYYPLPALIIVGLALFLPFLVAFKVVMVVGVLLLPAAVYVFLRGIGAAWPQPAVGASMSIPFLLFERSALVFGGNLASVLAGEMAFSLSLSLGFFGVGALASRLRSSRPGVLVVVFLLAAALASHVLVGGLMLEWVPRWSSPRYPNPRVPGSRSSACPYGSRSST